jgi:hypothetical protein
VTVDKSLQSSKKAKIHEKMGPVETIPGMWGGSVKENGERQ